MQLYSFSYLTSHLIFACADSGKVSKRFMFAICGGGGGGCRFNTCSNLIKSLYLTQM